VGTPELAWKLWRREKSFAAVPSLLMILLSHREYWGGGMEMTGKIVKSKLQKTGSFIVVEPLAVHQSTHTFCLLP
jgi:hypothetical protein